MTIIELERMANDLRIAVEELIEKRVYDIETAKIHRRYLALILALDAFTE